MSSLVIHTKQFENTVKASVKENNQSDKETMDRLMVLSRLFFLGYIQLKSSPILGFLNLKYRVSKKRKIKIMK